MLTRPHRAGIDESAFAEGEPYALAFSGGGDSLALLARLRSDPLLRGVLHVDHGLRDGSDQEAERARKLAAKLDRAVSVLRWEHDGVETRIQERAREARYGLMGAWCRAKGITQLVTAHHADDQAETVQMRIARGSGWRGASGMRPRAYAPVWPALAGVTLVRPALGLSRVELRSSLGKLRPIEDPSNENADFERIRVRRELADDPERRAVLLSLADKMAAGRETERARLRDVLEGHTMTHEGQLSLATLAPLDALSTLVPIVGGQQGPVDRSRLRAAREQLKEGAPVALGCGTIGEWDGARLTLSRDPVAMSGRRDGGLEATAVRTDITPEPVVWDGRFLISGRSGVINPERRGRHVGFRILFGRDVRVQNLVAERIAHAAVT